MLWEKISHSFVKESKLKLKSKGCITSFNYYNNYMLVEFSQEEISNFKKEIHEIKKLENSIYYENKKRVRDWDLQDIRYALTSKAFSLRNEQMEQELHTHGSILFFYVCDRVPEFKVWYGYNIKTRTIKPYIVFVRGKETILQKVNYDQRGFCLNFKGNKKKPHTSKRIKKTKGGKDGTKSNTSNTGK